MARNLTYKDIMLKLGEINKLAKLIGFHYVVIIDFLYFEFWHGDFSERLFRTSDIQLFYQKMNHYLRTELWYLVYDKTEKLPNF